MEYFSVSLSIFAVLLTAHAAFDCVKDRKFGLAFLNALLCIANIALVIQGLQAIFCNCG